MRVIRVIKEQRHCDICSRSGMVIRWTDANGSTWRCLRHSIRLLIRGA